VREIRMELDELKLTEEQRTWFGDRMTEGSTGAVRVPTYLINKLRKIADNEFLSTDRCKDYLIDKCY
jgi:hypothetical protein